jgi:cytochrome bd-type quinol oxidase subunit 2
MGSALALGVSLAMTGAVFLLMNDTTGRVAEEHGPLLRGLAWSWSVALVAIAAFYGELRLRRWRVAPQCVLLLLLIAAGMRFWPR